MYKTLLRPILFRFKSDAVHEFTVKWASKASESGSAKKIVRLLYDHQSPKLKQEVLGLTFRNPVGLAAGFDKNGTLSPIIEALGFGFTEVGSITAEASTGNPKPRSFRLVRDLSIINRMGLNNDGSATICKRLKNLDLSIPLGVNIAKTHNPAITGEDALHDYHQSFLLVKEVADYITLNISCPNTREGKTFEDPETLARLLDMLQISNDSSIPPVFIKFSVDLEKAKLLELIDVTRRYSVSGYVAVNTSNRRENLQSSDRRLKKIGKGGLSGKAITQRSNDVIRQIFEVIRGEKPIIGVGGIFTAMDAIDKIKSGADLIQVYTGLIYEGPSLVKRINKGIEKYMSVNDIEHIYQIRNS